MQLKILIFAVFLLFSNDLFCQSKLRIDEALIPFLDQSKAPFYHGVASGDPTLTSVVIWTKLTLPLDILEAKVYWEFSTDSTFNQILTKGFQTTNESSDFTVKTSISQLESNNYYYYRFKYKNIQSVIGKTKTLSNGTKDVKLAFASCSNYEFGYFSNYRFIAEDKNVDLVIHLGDYIYEYGIGQYGDTSIGRKNIPDHEILSLKDYRTRYSLYRLDPDLQKLHQLKPVITTWDDHEIADNTYNEGAENHQQNEGDWIIRKNAAIKAYFEWLPIYKDPKSPLYRSFSFGNLLNLIIIDTRVEERSQQMDSINSQNIGDSTRTILGKKQFEWLTSELSANHKWKIIGNQVPFGPIYSPSKVKKETYMDGWDGYPWERKKLISYMINKQIKNTLFITGDYHRSIALETDEYGTVDTTDNIAIELVIPSITSANDNEYYSDETAKIRKERYLTNNPNMKYMNNIDHGFLLLNISSAKIEADFIHSTTIRTPNGKMNTDKSFVIIPNSFTLH